MSRRGLIQETGAELLRIAALAFGVVAGLVASLILALGGLDPAQLLRVDPRQLSLIRFGLFIIANFGVLGAGVVLASPLGGTVLFVLGAVAWLGAALVLRHGPDYVMLVPPALLLVSAAFGAVAILRRRSRDYEEYEDEQAIATQRAAMAAAASEGDEEEVDEPGRVAVGASFFGDGGTATPMHGAMSARQPDPPMRRGADDDWQPVRRRTEPPRQKPMFRPVEDEYDEEPGFWRVSRVTSSILSFGLYGALVAAAILVFLNLRAAENRPGAAKIAATAPGAHASSSAPHVAAAPTLPRPSSAEVATFAPALATPSVVPSSAFEPPASTADASQHAPASAPAPATASPPSTPASSSAEAAASSAEPPADSAATTAAPTQAAPVPFEMSPLMAAARNKSAPRKPAPAASQAGDAGL